MPPPHALMPLPPLSVAELAPAAPCAVLLVTSTLLNVRLPPRLRMPPPKASVLPGAAPVVPLSTARPPSIVRLLNVTVTPGKTWKTRSISCASMNVLFTPLPLNVIEWPASVRSRSPVALAFSWPLTLVRESAYVPLWRLIVSFWLLVSGGRNCLPEAVDRAVGSAGEGIKSRQKHAAFERFDALVPDNRHPIQTACAGNVRYEPTKR